MCMEDLIYEDLADCIYQKRRGALLLVRKALSMLRSSVSAALLPYLTFKTTSQRWVLARQP
jgi:hypothetical protein